MADIAYEHNRIFNEKQSDFWALKSASKIWCMETVILIASSQPLVTRKHV